MIKETVKECGECEGHGFDLCGTRCSVCKGDGAVVIRESLVNGRTETVSWSESIGLNEPEPLAAFCPHGYGGFFRCPQGCHSEEQAEQNKQECIDFVTKITTDANYDYFLNRLKAHGMSLGVDEPRR